MQASSQIRMNAEESLRLRRFSSLQSVQPTLRFPADSKTLNGLVSPNVAPQHASLRAFSTNGRERAFTEVPANLKGVSAQSR
jgi:hypothetical protein